VIRNSWLATNFFKKSHNNKGYRDVFFDMFLLYYFYKVTNECQRYPKAVHENLYSKLPKKIKTLILFLLDT